MLSFSSRSPPCASERPLRPLRCVCLRATDARSPRSELGKISLDKTFEEREALNASIVRVINEAASAWGLQCLRYEIRDISPPRSITAAMELQAEAERRKRANVLDSEGERQAAINRAEGEYRAVCCALLAMPLNA